MTSGVHGWGVFATAPIEAGELLEECSIATIAHIGEDSSWGNVLDSYRFLWPPYKPHKELVVAFGFASLYNHSHDANAYWFANEAERLFIFKSTRRIEAGEEIFVNYGDTYTYNWK